MKNVFVDRLEGRLPTKPGSVKASAGKYAGGGDVLLRIDVEQVQPRGGVAIGIKLDQYCASRAMSSPLMLCANSADGVPGILGHIESNNERITILLADEELPVEDRKEMCQFLSEMNHKLQAHLHGRGELPVLFN